MLMYNFSNNVRKWMILVISLLIFPALSCDKKHLPVDKKQVVVTIPPLAEFVEHVGGDYVQVMIMVPPGASPHTYEPTPSQMTALSKADMYVKLGTPIEFELVWLDKLVSMNSVMYVCNASNNIDLITSSTHNQEDGENFDPHIWLSIRNCHTMIENIYHALASIDPKHESTYSKRAIQYRESLDSLDQVIIDLLQDKQNRIFLVYHSAWSYFARDYDLQQRTIEIGNKEPSAKTIQGIIQVARNNNIRVVFTSPQFNTKYARAIAQDIDGQVILLDPLSRYYIENMGKISQILAEHME